MFYTCWANKNLHTNRPFLDKIRRPRARAKTPYFSYILHLTVMGDGLRSFSTCKLYLVNRPRLCQFPQKRWLRAGVNLPETIMCSGLQGNNRPDPRGPAADLVPRADACRRPPSCPSSSVRRCPLSKRPTRDSARSPPCPAVPPRPVLPPEDESRLVFLKMLSRQLRGFPGMC